jgi:hypothetical protein
MQEPTPALHSRSTICDSRQRSPYVHPSIPTLRKQPPSSYFPKQQKPALAPFFAYMNSTQHRHHLTASSPRKDLQLRLPPRNSHPISQSRTNQPSINNAPPPRHSVPPLHHYDSQALLVRRQGPLECVLQMLFGDTMGVWINKDCKMLSNKFLCRKYNWCCSQGYGATGDCGHRIPPPKPPS